MRIAFLATQFVDYSFEVVRHIAGEAETLFLADAVKLKGDVDVAALAELPKNIRVVTFRQDRRWWRWHAVAKVAAELKRFRPNVVIAHEHVHPHITKMHRLAAQLSPLALIVHDPKPHMGRDMELALRRGAESATQRSLAALHFAHGAQCGEMLTSMLPGGGKTIHVIALGANFVPREFPPLTHARKLLMFGRMEAYKGLDLLLAAVNDLATRRDDFELVLAGRGPSLDETRAGFEATGRACILSGFIDREQAKDLFAACDAILAPYHEATQSGVVSLAYAFGRPVVAMAVGGLVDVIDHERNGLLVSAGDTRGFSKALEHCLYDEGTCERLAKGARDTFRDKLSWDVIARDISVSLRTIVEKG